MSDQEVEADEYQAVTSVLSSFYNFHTFETNQLINSRIQRFATLSIQDQQLIPWFEQHTQFLQQCIDINRDFCQTLAEKIGQDWGIKVLPSDWVEASHKQFQQTEQTMVKLMRDWSDQGGEERPIGQRLIIAELCKLYQNELERSKTKILVPGCGSGRLVFELVMHGFWTQGNDSSYHALFASGFILNHCQFPHNYSIFPFLALSATSSSKRQNQIRPVTVPDVSPTAHIISAMGREQEKEASLRIHYDELMSITAGSFIELYGVGPSDVNFASQKLRSQSQGEFGVVVTEFSLDAASGNVIDYIRTINNVLKQGGKWINFGPLLLQNGPSDGLNLTRDDLFELVTKLGFEFTVKESGIESTYCGDFKLLQSTVYKCDFWVCTKIDNL